MSTLKLIRLDQADRPPRLLSTGSLTIGRGMGCDIRIDNPTVSRRHARLDVLIDGVVRVTDLGSKNGTRINDRRLGAEAAVLNSGECLFVGDICFQVQSEGALTRGGSRAEMTILEDTSKPSSVSAMPYDEVLAKWKGKDDAMGRASRALFEMVGMLVAEDTLDAVVAETLTRLQALIEAHRYAVFLGEEDDDSDTLTLRALHTVDDDADTHFELSRTILYQALKERKALSLSDVPTDLRFAGKDSVVLQGVHSAMVVPLIEEHRVLGVLYVDSKSPVHRYNEVTLSIAVAFGHLLAAKIVQHQLFMARRDKEVFESELRVASGIQRGLMPDELPVVPGYAFQAFLEQTRMVGGDLYDAAVREDGRVVFLQADVAGKGVGAALLAANILSAFRILRDLDEFTIEGAVHRVSRHIAESSPDVQFATLFIGLLDPVTHRVSYVNAGHNPPLLLRRDGSVAELSSGNLPIGIDESCTWTQDTVDLAPGERLLVYTDGVLDATNEAGAQFGRARLEDYARTNNRQGPETFIAGLLESMESFTGDAPQADDLTLLLVARDES